MTRLIGFGLSIDSDRAIPGALADPAPGVPDLRIRTMPPEAPRETTTLYDWDGGTLTFAPPGVAVYRCRHDTIEVAAVPGADPEMVEALLIATTLPAAVWLRGDVVLHAAVVAPPGGGPALAIAGPSGIGKSTVAAQLLSVGGRLVADDSVRLRTIDGHVEASGLAAGHHAVIDGATDRTFHALPAERSLAQSRLGAVMILARTDGAPSLRRLDPVAAIERLLANRHRPRVPAILGRDGAVLGLIGAIAKRCEIYEWQRSSAMLEDAERAWLRDRGIFEAAGP